MQNNLFKRSTHRNYSSVANTPNITVSILTAAELQDNLIKSFVQALRRRPQKISIVTVYYHVASLRLIYTRSYDWGGEGVRVELSMYKMYRKLTDWNKCHFWWQPSYEYTVLFLLLLLLFFYIFPKEKKMHFIWVSMYLARKCWFGTLFLRLLLGTGPPFYVVIRATRRSTRLQGKGSTFISQLV